MEPGRIYAGTGADGVFAAATATPPQAIRGKALAHPEPEHRRRVEAKDHRDRQRVSRRADARLDSLIDNGATDGQTQGQHSGSQTFSLPTSWKRAGATGARYSRQQRSGTAGQERDLTDEPVGRHEAHGDDLSKLGAGAKPAITIVPPIRAREGPSTPADQRWRHLLRQLCGAAGGTVINKGPNLFKGGAADDGVCP